jgi:hypothetical protein
MRLPIDIGADERDPLETSSVSFEDESAAVATCTLEEGAELEKIRNCEPGENGVNKYGFTMLDFRKLTGRARDETRGRRRAKVLAMLMLMREQLLTGT